MKQSGPINFKLDDTVYWYPQDKEVIFSQLENRETIFYKKDKRIGNQYVYNVPAAFDIETSSFRQHVLGESKEEAENGGRIFGIMYIWQFSVNGRVLLGRTWKEFEEFVSELSKRFCLSPWKRLIVYDHNLGYEFQFMRKHFVWSTVFSTSKREPIYAINNLGLEFRDSYILTAKSLANVGNDLTLYPVEKLTGDLNYDLVRGPETPLTDKELQYCIHDDLVLNSLIQEKIEQENKGIASIPLTNTGYVRRFLKQKCLGSRKEARRWHNFMCNLSLDADEYQELKEAFSGGFTHANSIYVNRHLTGEIHSFDFTSSYPTVILSEQFPMDTGKRVIVKSKEELFDLFDEFCVVFRIKFNKIEEKTTVYDNPISISKCRNIKNAVENNGRLVRADQVETTITNIDFEYISKFYSWESFQVADVIIYEKDYLPKQIISAVLELYKAKTELKGIPEEAVNYMVKKGMLNSVYGCMVTDIVKALVTYDNNNGWGIDDIDVIKTINEYNEKWSRFLFYPWGVFVTAYARRNLFSGIYEFGEDYIYSDTDSIKCYNVDKHIEYIKNYNNTITSKVKSVLKYYKLDEDLAAPLTKDGVKKPIGIWDWETENSPYTDFKTCGAKRYMTRQFNKKHNKYEIHITIAGLSKKRGGDYISEQNNPWDFFSDEMFIPSEHTGKMTHTYIDDAFDVTFIDYLGKEFSTHEESAIALEKTSFTMSETEDYKAFIEGVQCNYRKKDNTCKNIIVSVA